MTTDVETASPAETLALGRRLAPCLQAGDVVLISGRLGSGKTLFVAGVAEGLGTQDQVTSPSFVLVQVYDGFMPIVHADVYRLGSTGELDDLELPAVAADGVLLVEWGGAIESGLPPDHLVVRIEILDEARRRFTFEPVGSWTDRSLKDLAS